jgi:predicted DCC family thiol-disulfide oxidoreductase YuxK
MRVLRRMDPCVQLVFVGNDTAQPPPGIPRERLDQTIVVIDERGRLFERSAAFARILGALPAMAPLGWLLRAPGVRQLADAVYDRFAARRHEVSAALGLAACGIPAPAEPRAVEARALGAQAAAAGGSETPAARRAWTRARAMLRETAVATLILACGSQVLIENRGAARLFPIHQPLWMEAVVQYPRLFQGWGMFAPDAPTDDGNLVIDGVTAEGQHFDPVADGPPRLDVGPPGGRYPMQQNWCDYANRIRLPGNAHHRPGLRDWLLREWRLAGRPERTRLVSFDVYWLHRRSPAPGEAEPPPTERERLLTFP